MLGSDHDAQGKDGQLQCKRGRRFYAVDSGTAGQLLRSNGPGYPPSWTSSASGGPVEQDNETFFGDGVTVDFALQYEPQPASSVKAYLNGMRITYGLDFSVNGNTVTMVVAPKAANGPVPADVLVFDYLHL